MLLQVIDSVNATNNLLQYGVLGVFAILLIGALVFVFKMYAAQHEKQIALMQNQIDELKKNVEQEKESRAKLESEFHAYSADDRKQVFNALQESTATIKENTITLAQIKAKL